jgi:DinB superfamily
MDGRQFFLQQYDFLRSVVEGMILSEVSEAQMRHHPHQGQNSLAWLVWHVARYEDFMMTILDPEQRQLFDREDWMGRMRLTRRDAGTAMTYEEAAVLSAQIDLAELRAYWDAVGQRTRRVAMALDPQMLEAPVDADRLQRHFADGILGSERARWVEQFFANRTNGWLLSFVNIHLVEQMVGEALCVRSLGGIGLGL